VRCGRIALQEAPAAHQQLGENELQICLGKEKVVGVIKDADQKP